ncbi:iron transporter [Singulisphaera sp. Ch08]|uniref:Iron transporter n=1 Tax=Singulisphaera sp. Ch08 TaxID=3120278 RepID=A0AAU7CH59_9BACT
MLKRWAGPLVTALIFVGVGLVVVMNLDLNPVSPTRSASPTPPVEPAPGSAKPAGFREYPIGDPIEQNRMRIAAVWLPSIQMDGMADPAGSDMIHLEADIHATAENPNGFALDEFVPYMKIRYKVFPAKGGDPIHQGELMPMIAGDGLHYGASLTMPKPGEYRLVFEIKPPSAGGLGRHSDPATGVAPWWEPFEASFDWDYEGVPQANSKTDVAVPKA